MVLLRPCAAVVALFSLVTGCTMNVSKLPSNAGGLTPNLFATARVHDPHASASSRSRESVVYNFKGEPDGQDPFSATLIVNASGDFFGTTTYGGTNDQGVVYKITPSKSGYDEKVLYSFTGGSDGIAPIGGLIADRTGAVYGTTTEGGNSECFEAGCGTVFKLPARFGLNATRTETVIYRFQGDNDGSYPASSLLIDKAGTLYGTTQEGGFGSGGGGGTVFKLLPSASGYQKTTLYAFQGTDGYRPVGDLIADKTGALYGVTGGGGPPGGEGTVYKLTASALSTLYSFKGGLDGSIPQAGVVADSNGGLYGTTYFGGTGSGCLHDEGCGTVFKLTPTRSGYTEKVLYSFQGGNDGAAPEAGVTLDHGAIYGTTYLGGGGNCTQGPGVGCGVIFKLTPAGSGYKETVVHSFQGGDDGASPYSNLTDVNGDLFGVTSAGGVTGYGTIYEFAK
jgi:uncharacterized repeat protein (TIGR03803 family)